MQSVDLEQAVVAAAPVVVVLDSAALVVVHPHLFCSALTFCSLHGFSLLTWKTTMDPTGCLGGGRGRFTGQPFALSTQPLDYFSTP